MSSRDAAVAILEALDGASGFEVEKAKVTAVNAGPPKTVNLLVNNQWAVPRVHYTPTTIAVNDAVYVLRYGSGKRVVIGVEQ